MPDILDAIIAFKKKEVTSLKKRVSMDIVRARALKMPSSKNLFLKNLRIKNGFSVIAEIKKKSPSKGIISKHFNPAETARGYEASGARAVSVLTDRRFFGGSAQILAKVRNAVSLPILRKDFMVDEYQIFESKLMGADAVLLIAAVLSSGELKKFSSTAKRLGLDVLFEVHSAREIKKILPLKPAIVGINNRDLRTFRVDTGLTKRLIKLLPKRTLVVSESGIRSVDDLIDLKKSGVSAFLVGETLMREKKPGEALKKLLGNTHG